MIAWHLLWFIGAGIIGAIIGWLWRKANMKGIFEEYRGYEKKHDLLKAEHEKSMAYAVDVEGKYNTLLADQANQLSKIASLNASISGYNEKVHEYESYSNSLSRQLESTKLQYVNLEKTNKSKNASIGILKDRAEVLKNQLETIENRLKEANNERQALKTDLTQMKAYKVDFNEVAEARQNAESKLINVQDELSHLKAQLSTINSQLADQKVKFLACQDKNSSLKIKVDELNNFKQKYHSLVGNSEVSNTKVDALEAELKMVQAKNKNLQDEVGFLQEQLEPSKKKTTNKVNTRIRKPSEKPTSKPLANKSVENKETPVFKLEASAKYTAKETEDLVLRRIRAKSKQLDFDHIGRSKESNKDDLKLIKGIGPFLEKKVNALGIYTFSQIANFRKKDIEGVNDAIEFFPGRIQRDDWVGQAKKLVKDEDVVLNRIKAKAKDLDFKHIGKAKDKDDLKLIKGVGPFLERKINALGIFTFQQVSRLRKKDILLVNNAIEFFPGRIQRDDWVGQAKKMLKEEKKPV